MNENQLITARDVARRLRVSLPYVYKLSSTGRLRSVRIPCPGEGREKLQTVVRFKPEWVEEFIEKYAR